MSDGWQQYQRAGLKRAGKDLSGLPEDVVISVSKKILVTDDILRLIWKIRGTVKGAGSDRQIIKKALAYYLAGLAKR